MDNYILYLKEFRQLMHSLNKHYKVIKKFYPLEIVVRAFQKIPI